MIEYLKGQLISRTPTNGVVEVNGIGYGFSNSLNTFEALSQQKTVQVFIHTSIREDAHTLYGFFTKVEREVFRLLTSVSGVGPSTARTMLSSMTSEEIQQAIASEDVKTIQSVKGIGAKTAQRVVLELKDKVGKLDEQGSLNISPNTYNTTKDEALSALITLGVAKSSAEKAVDKFLKQKGGEATVEEIINMTHVTALISERK